MINEKSIDKLRGVVSQPIRIEQEVIDLTEEAIKKAESPTVKYLLQAIQHDSRKHADFGRAALEILQFETTVGVKERLCCLGVLLTKSLLKVNKQRWMTGF